MVRTLAGIFLLFSTSLSLGFAPLTNDSSVDEVLDALDARGDDLRTLVADVAKSESDAALGEDPTTRLGRVVYEKQADGDVRIRASFDKVKTPEKTRNERIEYVLDNGELIDRSYRARVEVTHIVQRAGEQLNLFQLGKGPFPLPIGQAKEDVHAQFDVTKIAPAAGEPANTVHLKLTPKAKTDLSRKFQSIDVWVDFNDGLPRRVETLDATGTMLTQTELSNVKLNEPVKDDDFALERIDPDQWQIRREELK